MIRDKRGLLGISKFVGLSLVLIVLLIVIFYYTSDLVSFSTSTSYQSAKKFCELNEETVFNDASVDCNPKNCDVVECSEKEENRWNGLVKGFEQTPCYENKEECETDFEERMYAMVVEGESFNSPSDFGGQIDYVSSENSYSDTIPPNLITDVDSNYREKYSGKLSEEFILKVEQIASNLDTQPKFLFAVMDFETGGTFDPSVENMAGSGAVGLIQFMPNTAEDLGTSTSELSSMSRIEQLDYVEKYFNTFNFKYNTLEDVYMAVLYPKAANKGLKYVMFREGTRVYSQNRGLDLDDNGEIIVAEAVHKVGSHYQVS